MLAGNNKNVYRRLGLDIGKGVAHVVLIYGFRGDAPIDDLAENAAHGQIRVYKMISGVRISLVPWISLRLSHPEIAGWREPDSD